MNLSFVCYKYRNRLRIVKVEVWLKQSLNFVSVVLDKSCKEMFAVVKLFLSERLKKRPPNRVYYFRISEKILVLLLYVFKQ